MRRLLRLFDPELPPKVWLLQLRVFINLTPALRHGAMAVAHT